MSVKNICKDCFRESKVRMNFGYDSEAENEYHSSKLCNCPYNSPEEMMIDQDMGEMDPNWFRIAKNLLPDFKSKLRTCTKEEEEVRLFLKLLDYHTKNYHKSVELIDAEQPISQDFDISSKPNKPVNFDVFKERFI
jgi:hypothetical protein